MARTRSPEYPYISLGDAVEKIETIYSEEGRAPITKDVFAKHCGYASYNGSAAKVLAALKKYELISKVEGNFKLTEDAIMIVALKGIDSEGKRAKALQEAAFSVTLFNDLRTEFGLSASEANLTAQLQLKGFSKDGAAKAAKTYLSTMELVSRESDLYVEPPEVDLTPDGDEEEIAVINTKATQPTKDDMPRGYSVPETSPDVRTEVFNLDDGRVVIEYPDELSVESYEDLSDYMELFLRKLKRRITQ